MRHVCPELLLCPRCCSRHRRNAHERHRPCAKDASSLWDASVPKPLLKESNMFPPLSFGIPHQGAYHAIERVRRLVLLSRLQARQGLGPALLMFVTRAGASLSNCLKVAGVQQMLSERRRRRSGLGMFSHQCIIGQLWRAPWERKKRSVEGRTWIH